MEPAQEGHVSSSRPMLHDLEAEYVVKNVTKEEAQAILDDLPDNYYVIDLYYDANKKRMEFIIMLDDVEPVEISDHYDFMEQNHPECKKKFEQLHDFRTSFDDKETDEYNESAIDLLALNNRIIP
jgi:hypothetical protein